MSGAQRSFGQVRVVAGLAHALALVPRWLLARPRSGAARAIERRFMARIAWRLVARVHRTGASMAGPGTLYVANHVSWIDIPVLGSLLDADFVSKSDVRSWPLIGRLARRTGTLFIVREARHRVHEQAGEIAARLAAGDSLILFPEGTTSDGVAVGPFRSSLFEAAQGARCVQPLAILYHHGSGVRLDDAGLVAVGWTGDEPLGVNFRRVAGLHLSAEVRLAPAFAPPATISRKALAEQCRAAVVAAHAALRGQGGPD